MGSGPASLPSIVASTFSVSELLLTRGITWACALPPLHSPAESLQASSPARPSADSSFSQYPPARISWKGNLIPTPFMAQPGPGDRPGVRRPPWTKQLGPDGRGHHGMRGWRWMSRRPLACVMGTPSLLIMTVTTPERTGDFRTVFFPRSLCHLIHGPASVLRTDVKTRRFDMRSVSPVR